MPKMKTKSSVKKRFSVTGSGKLRATQSGNRHGMTKRNPRRAMGSKGTVILSSHSNFVRKFMPYGSN